jgi:hypothetical protein
VNRMLTLLEWNRGKFAAMQSLINIWKVSVHWTSWCSL